MLTRDQNERRDDAVMAELQSRAITITLHDMRICILAGILYIIRAAMELYAIIIQP